ncbi:MAG: 2-oxoacid:acceptor oxidoreductase family protein, partial [Candidatus Thiodiazotropha endolucinida]
GIIDDLSKTSLPWDSRFRPAASQGVTACLFYGLGADGTVSANKNSIKIIGEQTENHAQGYFQYDSKKSGAVTVSHLRFGPDPINSTYLIGEDEASFVACHQPTFPDRYEMLDKAKPGGVFLLNTSAEPDEVWQTLPGKMQRQIIDKALSFYIIDAYAIADKTGMGRRINTIMQTCFFAISDLLDQDRAIELIKQAVKKSYGRKGARLLQRNYDAIDAALAGLHPVQVPQAVTRDETPKAVVPADAPPFVQQVTSLIIAGLGDAVPVSLMPSDGTWPVGTTAYEKRNIALQLPKWEMDLCTHCGKCPLVCPHAAIRSKVFPEALTENAPDSFLHTQVKGGKDFEPGSHISYQVAPDDCTGCGLCVEICPIRDKKDPHRKALNMVDDESYPRQERVNWDFFLTLPDYDRTR